MKNWKQEPVPANMESLERDPRGFPIPYIVLKDENGKIWFQINDEAKVMQCIIRRLCAICGKPLGADMWLAGGPLSAFHQHGAYLDTPTHQSCGHYALKVCPYLAVSAYNKRLDASKVNADYGTLIVVDPTVIADRPPFFAYVKISNFGVIPENRYLIPVKPFLETEYWLEGEQITQDQAQQRFDKHYWNTDHFGIKV